MFKMPHGCCAVVTSPEQIFSIMARGFEQRAVGCHDINAHSSRSHCLLIVHVAATDPLSGVRAVGKLTLCDLAGSERINKTGATGACVAGAGSTAIAPVSMFAWATQSCFFLAYCG
jgi:kinesin family protein C2/C3